MKPRFSSRLVQTCLLFSLGAAHAAPLTGAFSWTNLGYANSDTLVGLSTSKTYLENVNLNGAAILVNSVPFAGSSGANPTGTGWAITGAPSTYAGGGTNPAGQLGVLTNVFIYGGTSTLSLSGLTVGQDYIVTYYARSWESTGARAQSLSANNNGPSGVTYDMDYAAAGQGELELLRYTFQATATTQTITAAPVVTANSMHLYGFGVEQLSFNKSWAGGGTWSTAVWSPTGVPNAQGANANFTAQGAPTAINLDANVTLGHLQLDGSNGWTLNSTTNKTLTLQADAGGVSVLSVPSGSHTISAATTWSNDLLKTGPGKLVLAGPITGTNKKVTLGDGTLEISNSTPLTLSGVISGGGSLTKSGSSTLTLASKSSYGGQTTVNAGTLKLQGTPTAGTGTVVTGAWTTANTYTFSPAANNLLAGLSPTANFGVGNQGNGTAAVTALTDGASPGTAATVYAVSNNQSILYTLPANATGYDLSKFNIYSFWNDSGRENITLTSIQYSTVADPNTFITLPASAVNYEGGAAKSYASFTPATGVLATGVYAVKFNFGGQENSWVGYSELEVIGTASVSTPNKTNDLPVTTPLVISSGSTLDLAGCNQQVASLADGTGGGSVINSAASTTSVLTLNSAGGSTSFSGTLGGGAGTTSLQMAGSGSLALSGNGSNLASLTGGIGALSLAGNTTTVATLTGGSGLVSLAGNNNSIATLVSGSGGLQISGSNNTFTTVDFTGGAATASNPLTVTSTLNLPGYITGTLTGTPSLTLQSVAAGNLGDNSAPRALTLTGGTLAFSLATPTTSVPNGSLETGVAAGYNYNPTSLPGWSFLGQAGTDTNGGPFSPVASTSGTHYTFVQNATGRANLTITPTQGGVYTISFDSIGRGVPNGPNPMNLYVDGNLALSWTPSSNIWQSYTSAQVALGAGPHTVSFQGQGGTGDLSSCVDNVTMAGIAPASLLVNFPNTSVTTSASSTLDLGLSSANHTLGGLNLTANGSGPSPTTLTLANANSVTVNGISTTAGSGTAAALGGATVSNAGDTVSVSSGDILTVSAVLADGNGGSARINALTKNGTGTLVLTNTNAYSGPTTINAGTLALGAGGAVNSSSGVAIAAGTTFDVSALSSYTLGTTSSLTASGSTSSAAALTGVVHLGSRPATLNISPTSFTGDASHPALNVSAGGLDLGTSLITVNNNSGTPLDAGDYKLIGGGTVTGTPTLNLPIGGAGTANLTSASLMYVGGNLILHVAGNLTTSVTSIALGSPWTSNSTYGDPLTFVVSVSGASPGGSVIVKDGGASGITLGSGPLSGGSATITLSSPNLLSATYHSNIVAVYGGDPNNLGSVAPSLGQNVEAKALTITAATGNPKFYDGTNTITYGGTLDGVLSGDTLTLGATFDNAGPGLAIPVTFTISGAPAANYLLTQPGISVDILGAGSWTSLAGNGQWSTAGNWLDNLIPSGANLPATFTGRDITADETVTLSAPHVIGGLAFGDTDPSSAAGWTLAGSTLTLAGTTPTISVGVLGTDKNATISSVLSGTDGMTKAGNGTLVLASANTYFGGTTINAGTLQLGNGGTTGSIGFGGLVNNGTMALDYTSGTSCILNNGVTGSGGFHVINGDLRIYGQPSTGVFNVDSGGDVTIWAPAAMTISNDFVLNSMGFASNRGAINQDGGAGWITLNGQITLAGDSRIGIGGGSWNSMTVNGKITGSGKLYVYESHTANPSTSLYLTNGSNDNSGGIEIDQGRLSITQIGALGSGPVTVTGANSQFYTEQLPTGIIPNNFTLGGGGNPVSTNYTSGNGTIVFHNDGQTNTFGGTVTLAGNAKIRSYSSGTTVVFSNPIVGAGNLTLEGGGALATHNQVFSLEGGQSTFAGNTTISSYGVGAAGPGNPIVQLNGGGLPSSGSLTINDFSGRDAVFDLNGHNQTIAGLDGTVTGLGAFVTNTGATSTLTISNTAAAAFGGTIGVNTAAALTGQAAGSDDISLVKNGTGAQTLAGANTYTGATAVNEGTLLVGASATVGHVTIADAGFETVTTANYTYLPVGGGWTYYSPSGICRNTLCATAPPEGLQAAFIQSHPTQGNGSITQAITVPATTLYTISFRAEARGTTYGPCGVILEVDGNSVGTWPSSAVSQSAWGTYQVSLPLAAGAHTLSFLVNNDLGGDKTVAIDNVQMAQSGVVGSLGNTAVNVASGATFGGLGSAGSSVTWHPGAKASFTVSLFTEPDNATPLTTAGVMTYNATEVHLHLPTGLPNGTYTLATSSVTPVANGAFPAPIVDSGSYAEAGAGGVISLDTATNKLLLTVSTEQFYQAWAGLGGPAFTDVNSENVAYGMAWMLGSASPSAANTVGLMPSEQSVAGTGLVLHFQRVHEIGIAKLFVQDSNDLGTWPSPGVLVPVNLDGTGALPGSDIGYTVVRGAPTDDITLTIPAATHASPDGRLFGRLSANEN
ncbi:MAG: autotransporter-associated beta strand repeat-containing protein [Verrucomicrobiota bacterium]